MSSPALVAGACCACIAGPNRLPPLATSAVAGRTTNTKVLAVLKILI